MTHRFLISQDSPILFITIVTHNRVRVFQTDKMTQLVCTAIDEARQSAGFLLFAYVIMLDHIHLLTSRPSTASDLLRFLKGITARRIIDYLKVSGYQTSLAKLQHQERDRKYKYSLWQPERNVFPIFSEGMFEGCETLPEDGARHRLFKSVQTARTLSFRVKSRLVADPVQVRGAADEDGAAGDGHRREGRAVELIRGEVL
jgi:REP element-mobilizing transposase RayT